jgi:rhodanese-related sulfurtransferase
MSVFESPGLPKNKNIKRKRRLIMHRKASIIILSLFLILAFSSWSVAAKVPAPEKGGKGFKAVSLKEAKKLIDEGAVVIACHSHTNDYLKGHIRGAIHITVMVPKDHKRIDFLLSEVDFDLALLPKDKNTPIITYCASNT